MVCAPATKDAREHLHARVRIEQQRTPSECDSAKVFAVHALRVWESTARYWPFRLGEQRTYLTRGRWLAHPLQITELIPFARRRLLWR